MWNRGYLKDRAKSVLKVSYWKALLVSLVIAIAGGSGGRTFKFNWDFKNNSFQNGYNPFLGQDTRIPIFLAIFFIFFIMIAIFALAFRIFVGYPLEVGGRRYFVQSAQGDINMEYLSYGFRKGKYLDIVKAMLWRGFLNFLWFLLLIIPGIVKAYAYSMVPYILGDNPNIGYKRALELSNKMTKGEKMDMWVLDLSFIGWYLLGTLLFFIGVLFVMPYENATKGELYLVLRQNALDDGLCSYQELGLEMKV